MTREIKNCEEMASAETDIDAHACGDNQEKKAKSVSFAVDTFKSPDRDEVPLARFGGAGGDWTQESVNELLNVADASASRRSNMYEKGEELLKDGKKDEALEFFLASLTGLSESNTFHELPQCLHEISDIYFEKNEYEKAVYFIQAEKMYYETALIDIVDFQKQMKMKRKTDVEDSSDTQSQQSVELTVDEINASPLMRKALEFESLAKMCLKEKKLQLAMEYCGKATKIFREGLGDEHAKTIATLELFTSIYADVGKKLYEDAMKKFEKEEATQTEESKDENKNEALRNRFAANSAESSRNEVHTQETRSMGEYEVPPDSADQDDYITTILLMVLFFLVTLFVGLIGSYIFCYFKERSAFCAKLKGDMTYWYMQMRHMYHYYVRGSRR